jgi:tetratricopeptide (TPR) repeat protein
VRKDAPPEEILQAVRLGVQFFVQTKQHQRADALLRPFLEVGADVVDSGLWRQAADVAQRAGSERRALRYLEQALELGFDERGEQIDLQALRNDYRTLLQRLRKTGLALRTLDVPPPPELVARVVQAADRWRSLDPDIAEVCQLAAETLQILAADDLAWGYMTSPLAIHGGGEASAWVSTAAKLAESGDVDLADRAYSEAYEREQSNAQILQDHAMMLMSRGRRAEALPVLRRLAQGTWQPRFASQKRWAEAELRRRAE